MAKAAEIWKRMQENATKNARKLAEFGLASDQAPAIGCGTCKSVESLLFWTVTGQAGGTLHLQCPLCEAFGVQYDAVRNAVSHANTRLVKWGNPTELFATAALLVALFFGVGNLFSSGGMPPGLRDVGGALTAMMLRSGSEIPAWNRDSKAGVSTETIYLAPGDRQGEVAHHLEQIGQEAELMQSVIYLPEFDQTRLVLAQDSKLWQSQLAGCGWERAAGSGKAAKQADQKLQGQCGSEGAGLQVAMRVPR